MEALQSPTSSNFIGHGATYYLLYRMLWLNFVVLHPVTVKVIRC